MIKIKKLTKKYNRGYKFVELPSLDINYYRYNSSPTIDRIGYKNFVTLLSKLSLKQCQCVEHLNYIYICNTKSNYNDVINIIRTF